MKRGMPSGAQTPDGIIFLLALIFSKAPPRYPPHHGAHWAYTSEIQGSVQKKLTRRECAGLLGVSVNSVNRYIKNGKLKAANISPRLVRIDPESVRELLNHGIPEDEIIVPQCHGKEAAR